MSALIDAARDWSRLYSRAERHKRRMAAQGSVKDLHDAIAAQQMLEDEFMACFGLKLVPDFPAVLERLKREAEEPDSRRSFT